MLKVLFAINNQGAEKKLAEIISKDNDIRVVGTMVSQLSIEDFLKKEPADVLMYREGLPGDADDFQFVIKLKVKYPNLRIAFIAGDRSPGDKKVPLLITYAIYDILAGQTINITDMAKLITQPATLSDVMKWLPGRVIKNGLFSDDELGQMENQTEENPSGKTVIEETPIETKEPTKPPKPVKEKKPFGLSLKDKLMGKGKPPVEEPKPEEPLVQEETFEPAEEDVLPKNITPIDEVVPEPEKETATIPEVDEPSVVPAPPPQEKVIKVEQPSGLQMQTSLISGIKEVKVPSRAAADEAEELMRARKKIEELERQKREAERAAASKNDDLQKIYTEYANLQKHASTNAKQRVVMFYGARTGVGCSTIALNVATYLAMKQHKVVYVEYNAVNPTLSYWYSLNEMTEGIEHALMGIEARAYNEVNKNIITKNKILELNTDVRDRQEKYPDMLSYMFFSDDYVKRGDLIKVAPNTLKDLLLLLLYKEGFDYVILDMYSQCDYHELETAALFSTTNVFVSTQDIVTVGDNLRKFAALEATGIDFEMLKESAANKKNSLEPVQNFKNFYVVNRFRKECIFSKPRINEWLSADDKTFYIPENGQEVYNAIYKAIPVILISKNRDYVLQIKKLAEAI